MTQIGSILTGGLGYTVGVVLSLGYVSYTELIPSSLPVILLGDWVSPSIVNSGWVYPQNVNENWNSISISTKGWQE